MEKYKVCPVCGTHNNPLFLECMNCETDLQSVSVVDQASEQLANQEEIASQAVMVRVCDCGTRNPVQSRVCSACGEDISTIMPTADTAPLPVHYVLSSMDGSYAYEISEGTTVIGREHEMGDYLSSRPYVSRKHAVLTLNSQESTLTVTNCSSTNHTFVNNVMLSGEASRVLSDGDELALGGNEQNGSRQPEAAYFTVRIGPCT